MASKKENPEPMQIHVKVNGFESDENSVQDDDRCEDFVENDITHVYDSDKMETNEDDGELFQSEPDAKNTQGDVESNDIMSISARSYKYDDRKNPFMDEVFDDSLTTA